MMVQWRYQHARNASTKACVTEEMTTGVKWNYPTLGNPEDHVEMAGVGH